MKIFKVTLYSLSVSFALMLLALPLTYALADAPTVTIQSVSPATTIKPGNAVYFTVVGSNFTSALTYTLADSFSGSSASSANINSSGVFAWIPTANDAGTHTFTVTVSDQGSNSAQATQQITVVGPPSVTINNVFPGTSLLQGQTVFFSAVASNFTNPVYSVGDSSTNSSLTTNAINQSGGFSWTPRTQDIGGHSITVTVTDSTGALASALQSISVSAPSGLTISSINPGSTVSPGTRITFGASTTGFIVPSYSLADSFTGGSINKATIDSNGSFSWTPGTDDVGSHDISVYASDSSGHNASATTTIHVNLTAQMHLSTAASSVISVGNPFIFSVLTEGYISPIFAITDTFPGSSLKASNTASNGYFSWTPNAGDVGIHQLSALASDSFGHSATSTVQVSVISNTVPTGTPVNAGSSTHEFTLNLNIGSSGSEVSALQTALQYQGFFTGSVTGFFGPLTATAVKKFQIAHAIEPVGFVGPATREALNGAQAVATSIPIDKTPSPSLLHSSFVFTKYLTIGMKGTDVSELQKRLVAAGFLNNAITGYFGSLTEAAVKSYQAAHGLQQLGVVGPGTRAALNAGE